MDREFRARNGGQRPSQEQLTAYHQTWTNTQVQAIRDRAWSALSSFGESFVDDARPGILRDALRGKFWPDVFKAMFAAFLYTLFLIAAVLVLRWNGGGSLRLASRAF